MGEKQREFLMAVLADRRHQPQVVPSIRDFKISKQNRSIKKQHLNKVEGTDNRMETKEGKNLIMDKKLIL